MVAVLGPALAPPLALERTATPSVGTQPSVFEEHVRDAVSGTDQSMKTAEARSVEYAEGRDNDLHGTMITLAEADVQFRFLSSVRNKCIEAYREVMRMGA